MGIKIMNEVWSIKGLKPTQSTSWLRWLTGHLTTITPAGRQWPT